VWRFPWFTVCASTRNVLAVFNRSEARGGGVGGRGGVGGQVVGARGSGRRKWRGYEVGVRMLGSQPLCGDRYRQWSSHSMKEKVAGKKRGRVVKAERIGAGRQSGTVHRRTTSLCRARPRAACRRARMYNQRTFMLYSGCYHTMARIWERNVLSETRRRGV